MFRNQDEHDEAHEDDRGYIQSLVNFPMKNLSLIFSNSGSLRSNHMHKEDWHYMYVLSGSFDYYFRPSETSEELQCVRVKAGEMIFTPPMEDHACIFTEDTYLVVASRNPRDQETYERDTVRVEFVNEKNISELLKTYSNI